jgi:hypothetical protein
MALRGVVSLVQKVWGESAFRIYQERETRRIMRRWQLPREEAEDLVQDGLLGAIRFYKADKCKDPVAEQAYVRKCVDGRVADMFEQRNRRAAASELATRYPSSAVRARSRAEKDEVEDRHDPHRLGEDLTPAQARALIEARPGFKKVLERSPSLLHPRWSSSTPTKPRERGVPTLGLGSAGCNSLAPFAARLIKNVADALRKLMDEDELLAVIARDGIDGWDSPGELVDTDNMLTVFKQAIPRLDLAARRMRTPMTLYDRRKNPRFRCRVKDLADVQYDGKPLDPWWIAVILIAGEELHGNAGKRQDGKYNLKAVKDIVRKQLRPLKLKPGSKGLRAWLGSAGLYS